MGEHVHNALLTGLLAMCFLSPQRSHLLGVAFAVLCAFWSAISLIEVFRL